MRVAALDIGGANLKGALHGGPAFTLPFELWRHPSDLSRVIGKALRERLGPVDLLGVTMTGELCDCFETRAEGVTHILNSVQAACAAAARGAEILVWTTDSRFVRWSVALRDPLPAAASNWLALAHLACEYAPRGRALLVDVGSTTTDVVPLLEGLPRPRAFTDKARLEKGELVYTGVSRTPVAAVVRRLPCGGRDCPVAAELFATTRDAYLILGHLREDRRDRSTADGRPATRGNAHARLARMVCADRIAFTGSDAASAARHIMCAQTIAISRSIRKVVARRSSPTARVVVSGSGEFLARAAALHAFRALSAETRREPPRIVSLSARLGPEASTAAPAVALAMLAAKWKESCP